MPFLISVLMLFAIIIHHLYKIIQIILSSEESYAAWKKPSRQELKETERKFLLDYVGFYKDLSEDLKKLFEFKVLEFLTNVKIVGVRTKVTGEDKILIACSAIIPILHFPNWTYQNLRIIFLHPRTMLIHGKKVMGLVGEGIMQDKMLLSKEALHFGFTYSADKRHTAIHEFMHLIDLADGRADGVPEFLMKKPEIVPWVQMMNDKLGRMEHHKIKGKTYTHRERTELLSTLSEYFFERPNDFRKEEPELYGMMDRMFNLDKYELAN